MTFEIDPAFIACAKAIQEVTEAGFSIEILAALVVGAKVRDARDPEEKRMVADLYRGILEKHGVTCVPFPSIEPGE